MGAMETTQVLNYFFAKIYNILNRVEQIYKYNKKFCDAYENRDMYKQSHQLIFKEIIRICFIIIIRSDTSSQYWMGAIRDQKDRTLWRWTGSGEEVSVSFWSLPQGTEEDCARYDGSRGWLWSDTPCTVRLNFICQHRK